MLLVRPLLSEPDLRNRGLGVRIPPSALVLPLQRHFSRYAAQSCTTEWTTIAGRIVVVLSLALGFDGRDADSIGGIVFKIRKGLFLRSRQERLSRRNGNARVRRVLACLLYPIPCNHSDRSSESRQGRNPLSHATAPQFGLGRSITAEQSTVVSSSRSSTSMPTRFVCERSSGGSQAHSDGQVSSGPLSIMSSSTGGTSTTFPSNWYLWRTLLVAICLFTLLLMR